MERGAELATGGGPTPKIACLCVTYRRPRRLAEAIACFERQDYPERRRELVILDDAGQYAPLSGPGWHLTSIARRVRTLGEKRNAAAALASPDADAYAVWDDDDIYMPWHLSSVARALGKREWSVPAVVFRETFGRLELHANEARYFHGGWGFSRELFERAGGYPFAQAGEDQALRGRFEAAGAVPADSSAGVDPSYIYRWFGEPDAWHLSALDGDGYRQVGIARPPTRVNKIEPRLSRNWEVRCRELLRATAAASAR
jgi:glycosyltransferase involved in cell wall biosynthesis